MSNELEVQYLVPSAGLTPTDLAELGAVLASTGLTQIEARGLMGDIQQASAQTALNVMPKILEGVRKVHESRILEMVQRVRALPNNSMLGFMTGDRLVSRDRVIQIIQDVATKTPRT